MPTLKQNFRLLSSKNDVVSIAILSFLLFIILHFIRITYYLTGEEPQLFFSLFWNHLALKSSFASTVKQPWSLLSHLFIEMSFLKLIGNMVWLWLFSIAIEDLLGRFRILPIFLVGGLLGALFLLVYNIFIPIKPELIYTGCFVSIVAVITATLLFKPHYKIWLFFNVGIPVWVLAIVFFIFQTLSFNLFQPPMMVLLLSGILTGFIYNYWDKPFVWLSQKFQQFSHYFWNNENFMVKKSNKFHVPHPSPNKEKSDQEKLNKLLDKIAQSGIESLSDQERKLLNELSNKL
ncbi:MAG: rhomboid family intramembrane serine protease [Chitinophagaceae bacterium]